MCRGKNGNVKEAIYVCRNGSIISYQIWGFFVPYIFILFPGANVECF